MIIIGKVLADNSIERHKQNMLHVLLSPLGMDLPVLQRLP